jgi:sulfur carrier protein ThiS
LKITLNGKPEEFNIGCRSFVHVVKLIGLLDLGQPLELVVSVNGKQIKQQDFASAQVKSGDKLSIYRASNRNNYNSKSLEKEHI